MKFYWYSRDQFQFHTLMEGVYEDLSALKKNRDPQFTIVKTEIHTFLRLHQCVDI